MYDLDSILIAVTPEIVAEHIGLETKRKGRNLFCECPSHRKIVGKPDGEISNCVLYEDGYKCFACGASGNVFDMVKDYCDVPFVEAVKRVAAIAGISENTDKTSERAKKPPFTANELELIGITTVANPNGDAGREIIGLSYTRPEVGSYFRRGDEYVLFASAKRITLNSLFQEDERLYYQLVADNAKIYLDKYETVCAAFDDRSSETFKKVFDLLSCDGNLDSKLVAEVRNVLFLNMRKVERIYKEAAKMV